MLAQLTIVCQQDVVALTAFVVECPVLVIDAYVEGCYPLLWDFVSEGLIEDGLWMLLLAVAAHCILGVCVLHTMETTEGLHLLLLMLNIHMVFKK